MEFIFIIMVAAFISFFAIVLIYPKKRSQNSLKKSKASLWDKLREIEGLKAEKITIGLFDTYLFGVDDTNEKIVCMTQKQTKIINYEDIMSVEIVEDGKSISTKSTTRMLGGALIGGALLGEAGAVIGGLSGASHQKRKISLLSVKIMVRDIDDPVTIINCFDVKTMTLTLSDSITITNDKDNDAYFEGKKNAEKIKNIISIIIDKVDQKEKKAEKQIEKQGQVSDNKVADELLKLHELKEKNILTEEEFNQQKAKLLGSN